MGALYGGKSDLFYNQFELYNREQKIIQIILLKDAIHRIKHTFNKEFSEVMVKKEQEISKVIQLKLLNHQHESLFGHTICHYFVDEREEQKNC